MACYAVMSITNPGTRASILAAGAIPRIIEAASAHPSDFYVQDAAWWAMCGLVKDMTPEVSAVSCRHLFSGYARADVVNGTQEKSTTLGEHFERVISLVKRAMKDDNATDKTRETGQMLLGALQDGVALRATPGPHLPVRAAFLEAPESRIDKVGETGAYESSSLEHMSHI